VKPAIRSAALVVLALAAVVTSGCAASTTTQDPADPAAIRAFADEMAERHGMNAQQLRTLLIEEASHQPDIIDAISNPAEALPWHRYRGIFLTRERIDGGVAYWDEHRQWLAKVEDRYGVPPHMVVAIIGIETYYGRYRGRHRVLDALRTLAFAYPPRADFFRSELEAFLQLTREESIDPTAPLGSYAGAMGVPQFISSSYGPTQWISTAMAGAIFSTSPPMPSAVSGGISPTMAGNRAHRSPCGHKRVARRGGHTVAMISNPGIALPNYGPPGLRRRRIWPADSRPGCSSSSSKTVLSTG